MADFIYPSNFILKGLYQNLYSNLEKNITKKKMTTMLLIQNFVKILLHCLVRGCDQEHVPPFMKLFWEEQQKYLSSSSSSSIRYHPMIIKYCLSLAAKSSAYSDLRYNSRTGSGVLILHVH